MSRADGAVEQDEISSGSGKAVVAGVEHLVDVVERVEALYARFKTIAFVTLEVEHARDTSVSGPVIRSNDGVTRNAGQAVIVRIAVPIEIACHLGVDRAPAP